MSYDISMVDANIKEVLKLRNPQYLIGGTYRVEVSPETGELVPAKETEASFNITYNYAPYYYAATEGDSRFAHDDGDGETSYGIRGIYGKTGLESIPMLKDLASRIESKYKKNGEWITTRRKITVFRDKDGKERHPVEIFVHKMEYTKEELIEAKRQIDSTLHKLRETIKTLQSKDNPERYKSQITLAKRRVKAFEIANYFIENEIESS